MKYPIYCFFVLFILISQVSFGQTENSTEQFKVAAHERDLIDVAARVLKTSILKRDTARKKTGRVYFSGSPSPGYSLSSGWAAILVANGAFYTSEDDDAKISNVYTDALYTQQQQFVFHLQSNIWTRHNKYNIINDWRFYSYPQRTYGLGSNSNTNDYVEQTYNYIRLNQTVLRKVSSDFLYAGIGYGIDYHYNITQTGTSGKALSDVNLYGLLPSSTSAGLNFAILYDNRVNSINPWGGSYLNIVYRPNLTFLGSDTNWQSLLVDLRKYVPFPAGSQNILAFWNYNWMTLSGNPPYLDLPATGWDSYSNIGRGYIQGRFRSKNMIYLEAEYRFRVTHNGLIGGVVFANAQTVTDWPSNSFQSVAPAAGLGLRLKFNKYSRTNVAIDYGFGSGGSQGIFVNLGEVF